MQVVLLFYYDCTLDFKLSFSKLSVVISISSENFNSMRLTIIHYLHMHNGLCCYVTLCALKYPNDVSISSDSTSTQTVCQLP